MSLEEVLSDLWWRVHSSDDALDLIEDIISGEVAAAIQAEREACAQIVEKNAAVCGPNTMLCDVLRGNAAAIRARCCDAT